MRKFLRKILGVDTIVQENLDAAIEISRLYVRREMQSTVKEFVTQGVVDDLVESRVAFILKAEQIRAVRLSAERVVREAMEVHKVNQEEFIDSVVERINNKRIV